MNTLLRSFILGLALVVSVGCGHLSAADKPAPAISDVAAPAESAAASEAPAKEDQSFKSHMIDEIFRPAMMPLWIASLILVAIVFERFKALRPSKVIDEAMMEQVIEHMGKGDIAAAHKSAKGSDTVIGRAWARALHEFSLGGVALVEVLNNTTTLALKPLKRNISVLTTIGVVSPLFGLFATVLGIIMSFSQMGAVGGANKAALAAAVGVALFGTAGGILLAIPGIIMSRIFLSRITHFAEITESCIYRMNYAYSRAMAESQNQK